MMIDNKDGSWSSAKNDETSGTWDWSLVHEQLINYPWIAMNNWWMHEPTIMFRSQWLVWLSAAVILGQCIYINVFPWCTFVKHGVFPSLVGEIIPQDWAIASSVSHDPPSHKQVDLQLDLTGSHGCSYEVSRQPTAQVTYISPFCGDQCSL